MKMEAKLESKTEPRVAEPKPERKADTVQVKQSFTQ
jgi:hypothetical protein